MKIYIKRAKNKDYYLAVFAKNGKELLRSSETYKRKSGVKKLLKYLLDAPVIDETL